MKIIHSLKANILQIAGLLAVILTLSFTFVPSKSEKFDKVETVNTVYFYASNNMSAGAFADPTNWSTTNSHGECGEPQPVRPCKITVPTGSSLSSVLSGKNNNQVLVMSQGYKSIPE